MLKFDILNSKVRDPNFIYEKIVVEKPEPVVKKAKPQAKQSVKEKKPRKPMSEEHKAKLKELKNKKKWNFCE